MIMTSENGGSTQITPSTATCEMIDPIVINADGSIQEVVFTPEDNEFLRGWQPSLQPFEKNQVESERVGRKIRALPKRCWVNARRAVLELDEYSHASYVEGYVVHQEGFLMEHGWVVRDGMIIDPTLPQKPYRYFPGLEFQGRAGIRAFLATQRGRECGKSPFHYAFGWGGSDSPSYVESMKKAIEFQSAFLKSREVA